MSKKYASHSAQFKFKVAVEAIKGTKTSAELCQEFGLSSSQIYAWKKQLEDAGPEVFSNKKKKVEEKCVHPIKALLIWSNKDIHEKIKFVKIFELEVLKSFKLAEIITNLK